MSKTKNHRNPQFKSQKVHTGIEGLDHILYGGLASNNIYLIKGQPGTGKTTIGLQYLLKAIEKGESALYISLSESRSEINEIAKSHGWDAQPIEVFELPATIEQLSGDETYTMFHSSEVENGPLFQDILNVINKVSPSRIVIDSLSELGLLQEDSLRFRRQILALKSFFAQSHATVLILESGMLDNTTDHLLTRLCHGVIHLECHQVLYGSTRRQVEVQKMRGVDFKAGFHDYKIITGGVQVYPRLVATNVDTNFERRTLTSGSPQMDSLLGGGIDQGTSNLLIGAAGSGKTSLSVSFATSFAQQGLRALVITFDENSSTIIERAERMGFRLSHYVKEKKINIVAIEPGEMRPGQFMQMIAAAVEEQNIKTLVIDSLNGYLQAMLNERFLIIQMHELFSYLNKKGVITLAVVSQTGLLGQEINAPVDISYVADTVIYLRYFEAAGKVRKAISVVKKRSGNHESTIREFKFKDQGLELGEPLVEFQGVLEGNPSYFGSHKKLMANEKSNGEHEGF